METVSEMETYTNLTDAIAIVTKALRATSMDHPSWDFISHAKQYLTKQADAAMRGEVA